MERLTTEYCGDTVLKGYAKMSCEDICNKNYDCLDCVIQKAFDKLAHYEDLEEQGLLLKLPCKVGEVFYRVGWNKEVDECEVQSITLEKDGKLKLKFISEKYRSWFEISLEEIGKKVFLTKEEAEAKLKEMEGES